MFSSASPAHRNFWRTQCGLLWKEHLHPYGVWQPVSPCWHWFRQHAGEDYRCAKLLIGTRWSKLPAEGQQPLLQSTASNRLNWSCAVLVNYRPITLSSDMEGWISATIYPWMLTKHHSLVSFIYSIQLKFTTYTRITKHYLLRFHGLVDFDDVVNYINFSSIKTGMKPGKCIGLLTAANLLRAEKELSPMWNCWIFAVKNKC